MLVVAHFKQMFFLFIYFKLPIFVTKYYKKLYNCK